MKKLLKVVVSLAILLVITALAAPLLISADTLKTKVAAELSNATGRTITIEGKASLKLFPVIAVTLEKVTLGNPAGEFKSARMFYANKLDTGVELMPLLHKEIIITGVTLDGAEINLEENAAGAKNWEFASKASSDTKQDKVEKEGAKTSKFAIGDIAIDNSSVSYLPATGKSVALKDINITLSGADGSEPLALDGSVEYKGETVNLSLDVKDSRGFLAGKSSEIVADVDLPGGSLHFGGTAERKQDITASGDLKLDIAALPTLLQWATGKPASASLPKAVSLASPLAVDGKRITLSKLTAKADDLTASGKLAVDASGAVPAITGALHLGTIDTARFSSAPAATGAAPAAGAQEGWSDKPIDLSALNSVNAKLALAIDGIKAGKLTLGNSAMDVYLQDGVLQLGFDKINLYEGSLHGSITASSRGAVGTDLAFSDIAVEPLLTALSGSSRLSGKGKLNVNVHGNGKSQKAIVSNLAGNISLVLRDGAVKGINIGQFLRNVKQGNVFADSSAEATDFAELSGNFLLANGIASNNDLSLKAPILRMGGSGTINLPTRSLNYRLTPTLVASGKGQDGKDKTGLTIPLMVTGSWSKPKITPDLAGVVEEGLKNPEALKENLKNIKAGIKDFNSPSDIGKALLGGGNTTTEPATTDGTTTEKKDVKQQAIEGLFKALNK